MKLEVIGNLGNDAELRYTQSGTGMTKFSLADTRKFSRGGEEVKETCWFRVTCFGELAEKCAHLNKGKRVKVEGRLSPDPDTGGPKIWKRNDGTPGASYEMIAFSVEEVGKNEPEPEISF
jgi:single-strand DNA-binding protein